MNGLFSNSRGYGTEVLMGIEVGCTPYDRHTSRRNEYNLVYRGDISTCRLGEWISKNPVLWSSKSSF